MADAFLGITIDAWNRLPEDVRKWVRAQASIYKPEGDTVAAKFQRIAWEGKAIERLYASLYVQRRSEFILIVAPLEGVGEIEGSWLDNPWGAKLVTKVEVEKW